MENIKKNPLSLQLNAEDFLPASNEDYNAIKRLSLLKFCSIIVT